MDLPDGNPKTVFGLAKPGFAAIPPVALIHLGAAMQNGREKYGLMNWREKNVSASVYRDAMERHLLAWWDGEQVAPDSGVHHLGHVMACCAILLDAEAQGALNDDRPPIPGKFSELVAALTRPMQPAPEVDVERAVVNDRYALDEPAQAVELFRLWRRIADVDARLNEIAYYEPPTLDSLKAVTDAFFRDALGVVVAASRRKAVIAALDKLGLHKVQDATEPMHRTMFLRALLEHQDPPPAPADAPSVTLAGG